MCYGPVCLSLCDRHTVKTHVTHVKTSKGEIKNDRRKVREREREREGSQP